MRKVTFVAMLLAIAVMAFPAFAADSPQKPGKWQMKMEMQMPGMPFKVPPVTMEVCVTEEDLKDPQKSVPSDPKSNCKVGDYKVDGKTVSWTIDCPDQEMKGSGQATYDDTTFNGWTKVVVGEQEMKSTFSGKWLGECKK